MPVSPEGIDSWVENAESTPPTFGGSVFNSFARAATTVPALIVEKAQEHGLPVSDRAMHWKNIYDHVTAEDQKESELISSGQMIGRKVGAFIPNIIGSALDPVSVATGYVGGVATGFAVRALVPSLIARATLRQGLIAELGSKAAQRAIPRTISEFVAAGAHGSGALAAYSVPGAGLTAENGVEFAKEVGANGAMGFGLGVLGYGMGVLWHSFRPKAGKTPQPGTPEVPEHLATLDKALAEGKISKQEHELMKDYLTNPDDPTLPKRFSEIMLKRGHQINSATYQAYFEMLSEQDLNNLKNTFPTELANHELATDKNALSETMLHSRLDEMRQEPTKVNGLIGAIDEIDHKLKDVVAIRAKADEVVDRAISETSERMPFDQQDLREISEKVEDHGFTTIKKEGFSAQDELIHIKQRLLGGNPDTYYRGYGWIGEGEGHAKMTDSTFGRGYWITPELEHAKHYGRKFEVIRGRFNLYDVRNGKDKELNKIHRKLILMDRPKPGKKESWGHKRLFDKLHKLAKKKGYEGFQRENQIMLFEKPEKAVKKYVGQHQLKKDFHRTDEYKRLTELANHWPQAKALLDRVHLENDIERQEAFRDVAQAFVDVLNSNIDKFADPVRVNNYLRERIEQLSSQSGERSYNGKVIPISEIERTVKEARKIPVDENQVLNDYEETIKASGSDSTLADFSEARERYDQFKASESSLEEMIDCFGRR